MSDTETRNYPPPWKLNGSGYIFPFRANREKILQSHTMSPTDKASYRGGIGAYMLVNYHTTDIGPYYELLFIPGDFLYEGKLYKRITKIFVSSKLSVDNGRKNWAIPKERASFTWNKQPDSTKIQVYDNTRFIADFEFGSLLIPFPIHTGFLGLSLLQHDGNGTYYKTKPEGSGLGRLAFIKKFYVNSDLFPMREDVGILSPLGVAVRNFDMIFPVAEQII